MEPGTGHDCIGPPHRRPTSPVLFVLGCTGARDQSSQGGIAMFFTIADIPDIMKNLGWRYGKQLMDTWFFRPAAVAPNYSKPVTDIIKMDWVLSFTRARKVFDELVAERIWTNLPARNRILDVLRAKGGYFDS